MSANRANVRGIRLEYPFDPLAKRAMAALGDGLLSHTDYVILAFIYGRADWAKLGARHTTPRLTLTAIAEGINWGKTHDALSKRLRGLRDKPERWFDYRVEGRRTYRFTLFPEAPEPAEIVSDLCPTSEALPRPSYDASKSPADPQITPSHAASTSEFIGIHDGQERPRSPSICPSSEHAANAANKLFPPFSVPDTIRALQNSQRNLSVKTNLEDRGLQEDRETTLGFRWPDTTGLRSEQAIIACCDALVAAGEATWVEEESDLAAHIREPLGGKIGVGADSVKRADCQLPFDHLGADDPQLPPEGTP